MNHVGPNGNRPWGERHLLQQHADEDDNQLVRRHGESGSKDE